VSDYDDAIWEQVPEDPGPLPTDQVAWVRSLGPVRRALDLGCGDGRLTAELQAGTVVGAEVSGVALERARARLPGAELVKLEPGGRLPFEDSSFDLVLCADMLEHVLDLQTLLSEVRRVLRPGGELAVSTPAHSRLTGLRVFVRGFERAFDPLSPHIRFFTRRSLRALLDAMGYQVEELDRVGAALFTRATR
jgi:SAM-dependent methyltransferase